jgi:hypothetical protein
LEGTTLLGSTLPQPHHLGQSLTLGHAKKYAQTTKAFAPMALILTLVETIGELQAFHPSNLSSHA